MRISIASDHAAKELQQHLIDYLKTFDIDVDDITNPREVDYPAIALQLCNKIKSGKSDLGVLLCGTGIGMSMAANKVSGIRAAVCSDTFSAKMCRKHNDANVICIGARVVGFGLAEEILHGFFTSKFTGGRHARRVAAINELDEGV